MICNHLNFEEWIRKRKKNSMQREKHRQRLRSWMWKSVFWELSLAWLRQNGTLALAKRMEQTVAFVGELRTGCSEKEPERFRVG